MFLVHSGNGRMARPAQIFESQHHRPGCSRLLGGNQVPYRHHQRTIRGASRQRRIGIESEAITSQLVQKFERGKGRLGNSSGSDQSIATVERFFHHALFFENIREAPVRHLVHQPVALPDGVGHPRPHIYGVGNLRLVLVTGVELAPDQRQRGQGRSLDLIMHLLYRPAHHAVARNVFIGAKHVFCAVVAVNVGGDEIHRNVLLRHNAE